MEQKEFSIQPIAFTFIVVETVDRDLLLVLLVE